ncbi:hypothetical protein CYY_008675 [Polysphondylium violaceum]|uniref:ABC transporter domain-containing protein n=1 Tax=Polysphondylium violaceum TaxID=133409 RepID=A0A8J4UWR6_9MYCE|nr:hypothetical protein CYY_008675 [Polysphondylium violaceum]
MTIYAITYYAITNATSNIFYQDQQYPTNFANEIKCCEYIVGYSYNGDPMMPDVIPLVVKNLDMNQSHFVHVPQQYLSNQTGLITDTALNSSMSNYFATIYFNRVNETEIDYTMYYNYSVPYNSLMLSKIDISYNNPVLETYAGAIQLAVEQALINTLSEKPELHLTFRYRKPPSGMSGSNYNNQMSLKLLKPFAMVFIYFVLTFPCIMFLNMRAEETQRKIRAYLKTFGVYDEIYLASWLIDGLVGSLYNCVVLLIFGYSCPGFDFFNKTNPSILFIVFTTYSFTINSFCLLLGSVLTTTKGSVILSVIIFTLGLFSSVSLSLIGPMIYNIFSGKYSFIGAIFSIVPFLNINKILNDIGCVTTPGIVSNFDSSEAINNGYAYTWHNFTGPPTPEISGVSFNPPSAFQSLNILFAFGLVALFFSWYLDKTLRGPFGAKKPWNFLFTREYWTPTHIPYINITDYDLQGHHNSLDPDIIHESDNVTKENMTKYALIIRNITKEYHGKLAVDHLSLAAENGKIVGLLGPNGTGKTTIINMITGLTNPSSGLSLVYGFNSASQATSIHTLIGYTPQFDVNWPAFTAREHLRIMTSIKEKRANLNQDIEAILKQIRLTSVADNPVGSYSGGMQRRLSCGLALIGNPKIIILDEPTTGVDPANRLYLWRLIKSMKKDRLILLTSHSMEEVDALCDKIAIMSSGKLAAVGTPTHLKSKYSTGFKLHLITSQPDQAIQTIQEYLPTAILNQRTSNTLIYTIHHIKYLSAFLKYLSQDTSVQSFISDWQIQGTTIEDVFLTVVADQKLKIM